MSFGKHVYDPTGYKQRNLKAWPILISIVRPFLKSHWKLPKQEFYVLHFLTSIVTTYKQFWKKICLFAYNTNHLPGCVAVFHHGFICVYLMNKDAENLFYVYWLFLYHTFEVQQKNWTWWSDWTITNNSMNTALE